MIHHIVFATAALIYRFIVGVGPVFLIWFAFICLVGSIWKFKKSEFKSRCLMFAIGIAAIALVILIEPESYKMRQNDDAREAKAQYQTDQE